MMGKTNDKTDCKHRCSCRWKNTETQMTKEKKEIDPFSQKCFAVLKTKAIKQMTNPNPLGKNPM